MEIFKDTNFDFLGKKVPFIIVSLVLTVAGIGSIVAKGGLKYGIDFRGGAVMNVKFSGTPPVAQIRSSLQEKIPGEISVQALTDNSNEVIINTELRDERELNRTRQLMIETLNARFGSKEPGKLDFNNATVESLTRQLREPLQRAGVQLSEPEIQALVKRILDFRNTPPRSGVITNFDQLSAVEGVTPAVLKVIKEQCALGSFAVRSVEVVGPKVAGDLRKQAVQATLLALLGMLIYIAFRFEWIYGVAAVVAVFHDTIVTIGFFSLFDKEMSLTVIAALLTLVGYSMNDTIVIFDRIRENLKTMRRESIEYVINKSVNQTLSRTVMASGLTFLTVMALWVFGGPVLNGFAFALVVGILVGTYSSIFIASPIVIWWQNYTEKRKRSPSVSPAPAKPAAKADSRPLAKKAR